MLVICRKGSMREKCKVNINYDHCSFSQYCLQPLRNTLKGGFCFQLYVIVTSSPSSPFDPAVLRH